jgi:hypothetical protein
LIIDTPDAIIFIDSHYFHYADITPLLLMMPLPHDDYCHDAIIIDADIDY